MSYRILGPVEVAFRDNVVSVGGPRERKALGLLLLDAGRPTPTYRLAEVLWGTAPPSSASAQLRNVMAILRRRITEASGQPAPITRCGNGFMIEVKPGQLDLDVFRARARAARDLIAVGNYEHAVDALRSGLALWRGPLFGDLDTVVLETERHQLEEERLAAVEQAFELEVALGRCRDVVGELATLVARHPLRERLVELHMLALYRCGRRQAALDSFARARARLREQVGLDPRPQLLEIHAAVLQGDRESDGTSPWPPLRHPAWGRRGA